MDVNLDQLAVARAGYHKPRPAELAIPAVLNLGSHRLVDQQQLHRLITTRMVVIHFKKSRATAFCCFQIVGETIA